MKTTEQAYAEFPSAVRASFPLYVRNAGPQARGLPCCALHVRHLVQHVLIAACKLTPSCLAFYVAQGDLGELPSEH